MSLPGEVVQIPSLVSWCECCPTQGDFQHLAEFFLYQQKELKLTVFAVDP